MNPLLIIEIVEKALADLAPLLDEIHATHKTTNAPSTPLSQAQSHVTAAAQAIGLARTGIEQHQAAFPAAPADAPAAPAAAPTPTK